jgi:phage terminase small subunit
MCVHTVKDAFTEYEAARQLALQEANPSAAVSAVTGKVKLFGLDQPSKIDHQSSDGSMTPKGIPEDVITALDAIAGKITGGDSTG